MWHWMTLSHTDTVTYRPSRRFALLSIEWDSIRLWGTAHGIVAKTQNSVKKNFQGQFFVCLKLDLMQLFPSKTSFKFTGEIVNTSFVCLHLHLWCQCCWFSRILDQSEVSHNTKFYGPQRSCGKVMFLHLSVSHSVHRRGVCPSMHHRSHDWGSLSKGFLSRGCPCPGGCLSRGSLSRGGLCLGGSLSGIPCWTETPHVR